MSQSKSLKAIALGHICLDICHPDFKKQQEIVEYIQPGMTYSSSVNLGVITNPLTPEKASRVAEFLQESRLSTGGGVSNTGIPLYHLMPGRVMLSAKVGDDIFSRAIDKVLVDPKFLGKRAKDVLALKKVPEETTSYTIVMSPGNGKPTFYAHYPGTNDTFTAEDIDFNLVAQAEGLEFSYPTLMKQCYTNTTNLRDMFKPMANLETKVFVDMHTLEEGKPSGQAPWNDILANALPHVHRFMPSLPEALFIYDLGLYKQVKAVADKEDKEFLAVLRDETPGTLRKMGRHFLDMGASGVIIKCGKNGAYLVTGKNDNYQWNNREIFVNTYIENSFKDSIGAGDNSIAAEMASELEGYSPAICLKNLVGGGTLNVETIGPIGAFHSFRDFDGVRERNTIPFNPGRGFKSLLDYFVGDSDSLLN